MTDSAFRTAIPVAALLAALSTPASAITVEALGARLANQNVTGATIIVHGWQAALLPIGTGDALLPLAQEIRNSVPTTGWLIDMDLDAEGLDAVVHDGDSNYPGAAETGTTGHVVILFDWAVESDDFAFGWAEAAGDALFNLVNALQLADPAAGTSVGLHFISHSYGSGPMGEAMERLARYGVTVDHATYLDAHDYDQNIPGSNESFVKQWTHGLPADADAQLDRTSPGSYGATVWNNVTYADAYYETRGLNNVPPPENVTVPRGRAVPGAFNDYLEDSVDLPASYPSGETSGDHSYTWNCFYLGTVLGAKPSACQAAASPPNYTATGFYFSQLGGGVGDRPAPVFFGADQGFTYDAGVSTGILNTTLALANGNPDTTELANRGLTQSQVTDGRWSPEWDEFDVYNGDFQRPGLLPFTDTNPGWVHHGGGGSGDLTSGLGSNVFLRLSSVGPSRTHNRSYVSPRARYVDYRVRVSAPSTDDTLDISLGGTSLGVVSLTTAGAWEHAFADIPVGLRGTVQTLTFQIVQGGPSTEAIVDIDDIRFDDTAALPALPVAGLATLSLLVAAAGFVAARRRHWMR